MGTFIIPGKDIEKFLNYVTLGNMSGLPDKKARYSMFLNEDGGIRDDVIVYKFGSEYIIVVNAGNLMNLRTASCAVAVVEIEEL
jgi:aminomethyltransferase